jgi:7-keto-8-aminopelargonate synthetase-like enzyme
LPGPCAAAALEAFNVIEREPERVQKLQNESTIAVDASRRCMEAGVFALPVTFPAVQNHLSRLRLIPLCTHSHDDLLHSAMSWRMRSGTRLGA